MRRGPLKLITERNEMNNCALVLGRIGGPSIILAIIGHLSLQHIDIQRTLSFVTYLDIRKVAANSIITHVDECGQF